MGEHEGFEKYRAGGGALREVTRSSRGSAVKEGFLKKEGHVGQGPEKGT